MSRGGRAYEAIGNAGRCERCSGSLAGQRSDARYCSARCRTLTAKRRIKVAAGRFVAGEERLCLECGHGFKAAQADNHWSQLRRNECRTI